MSGGIHFRLQPFSNISCGLRNMEAGLALDAVLVLTELTPTSPPRQSFDGANQALEVVAELHQTLLRKHMMLLCWAKPQTLNPQGWR